MRAIACAAALTISLALSPVAATVASAEEAPQNEKDASMQASAKVVQSMIDTYREGDFAGWLRHFSRDVTYIVNGTVLMGRAEMRKVHTTFLYDAEKVGLRLKEPEILESGWTGDRIYIWYKEFVGENEMVVYAEYEVRGGEIVTVVARF